MRSANNIDGGEDWVERSLRQASVFADSEIGLAFIESEAKMKFPYMLESGIEETELTIDLNVLSTIECEVARQERNRLIGPRASVTRIGNTGVTRAFGFARVGLAELRDARASKDTETQPVIDGVFGNKEDVLDRRTRGLVEEPGSKSVNHCHGERFLARTRFFPGRALPQNLGEHRQRLGTFAGNCTEVEIGTGLRRQHSNGITGC